VDAGINKHVEKKLNVVIIGNLPVFLSNVQAKKDSSLCFPGSSPPFLKPVSALGLPGRSAWFYVTGSNLSNLTS
jgi:hypothetical protein